MESQTQLPTPSWNPDPEVIDDLVARLARHSFPDAHGVTINFPNGTSLLCSPFEIIKSLREGTPLGQRVYELRDELRNSLY